MTFLLANWRLLGLALLIGAIGVQTWRLDRSQASYATLEAEFQQFKGAVAALGEKAKADAALREAEDKRKMEAANAENARTRNALNIALNGLRKLAPDPRRSLLPVAPAGSSRPDLACFDRTEYQRADGEATGRLFEGARSLADEGSAATVDLDSARRWAQQLR